MSINQIHLQESARIKYKRLTVISGEVQAEGLPNQLSLFSSLLLLTTTNYPSQCVPPVVTCQLRPTVCLCSNRKQIKEHHLEFQLISKTLELDDRPVTRLFFHMRATILTNGMKNINK